MFSRLFVKGACASTTALAKRLRWLGAGIAACILPMPGPAWEAAPLEDSWLSKSLANRGTLILQSEDYMVWGCSPIYDDAGTVHVFFSRWPKQKGH